MCHFSAVKVSSAEEMQSWCSRHKASLFQAPSSRRFELKGLPVASKHGGGQRIEPQTEEEEGLTFRRRETSSISKQAGSLSCEARLLALGRGPGVASTHPHEVAGTGQEI